MRRVSALIAIEIAAIFAMSFSASAEEPTFEAPELELKFNLKEENDGLSQQNKLPGEPEATSYICLLFYWSLVYGLIGLLSTSTN